MITLGQPADELLVISRHRDDSGLVVISFAGEPVYVATVAGGIVQSGAVTETIAFDGLVGAIVCNLITWYFGLPASSIAAIGRLR